MILNWFKNCVLIDKSAREADYNADPNVYEINNPEDATFKITDVKLFVPVVTLSKENDIQLLEQLKTGLKISKIIQSLQLKNGLLLTVNLMVIIHKMMK